MAASETAEALALMDRSDDPNLRRLAGIWSEGN
jgi:hypothetical protein